MIKDLGKRQIFIDGLKSNYLVDVFIDSKNRIWYGCHTGLSVYDGKKIHNFDMKDGLPSQSVTKIFEDSKGKFGYCQTMDGMRKVEFLK